MLSLEPATVTDRRYPLLRYVATGVGANFGAYSLPRAIQPYYGGRPVGGNICAISAQAAGMSAVR